jgi:hypothetical protein
LYFTIPLNSLALAFLAYYLCGFTQEHALLTIKAYKPMSKKPEKKADYINTNVVNVSKRELLKSIIQVQERNKEIDEKVKFTSQSLSVRAGQ